jgi:hypothetical protein
MSVRIGGVRGPSSNSPNDTADVWCSRSGVEVRVFNSDLDAKLSERQGVTRTLDPVAARNFAALLVRASDEVERMRAASKTTEGDRQE